MALTPNMDLDLPVVQLTIGPDWASQLNTALELVDSHDHTPGHGALLGTASFAINADLTFNGFAAINLERSSYDDQIAALTDVRSIYAVNGDLYYTNTDGDQVQITAGNSLAGTPGAITGLGDGGSSGVYYDATNTLAFYHSGASQAKFDISTIQVHAYDATGSTPYTEHIDITAPTATVSYVLTLPAAVPTQTGVIGMDTTGAITKGLGAGTNTAPSMYFTGDPNTGLYSDTADNVKAAANGINVLTVNVDQFKTVAGTEALPGYSFIGDPNTGMSNSGADQIAFSTGGVARFGIEGNQILSVSNGSAGAPSYAFDIDAGTGMYRPASLQLGFSVAGTQSAILDATTLRVGLGSAAAPAFSFLTDSDTGVYRPTANTLGISTAGAIQASFTSTGQQFYESGVGQGELKWKLFTGTLAGGSTTNITAPGVNMMAYGRSTRAGSGTQWGEMGTSSSESSSGNIVFDNDGINIGTSTATRITNQSGSANQYRIVIFYQ